MEERKDKEIELKSEQMNEMLSHPPAWITRAGNGVFLLVLGVVIFLSWFIRYPDEVNGEVIVTTSQAPIELSNQSYIQLKELHVRENQEVRTGDLIAQFDPQVKASDIREAKSYLDKVEIFQTEFVNEIPEFHKELNLGTYQEQWATLLSKIHEWNVEHAENRMTKELDFIRREISFREQLQAISGKKIKLSENEYILLEEKLTGSERLAEQHAISKQLLTQDKHSWNQALQTVQGQKEQFVLNQIALNSLRKERFRLEQDAQTNKLQRASEIRIGLTSLGNNLQNWEKNVAWTAPCSGKILFNKLLQVNRFYKANEASVVIVPHGSGYSVIASVKSSGSGKLKTGQKAFIELTDYPKTEFGMLEGKVRRITQMDKEGKYELQIDLLHALKTTYNKQIPPKARLKGNVKIITKDKRLLQRFFEQFTELIK